MSLIRYNRNAFNAKDQFLTPFDHVFDQVFANTFPELSKEFGVGFFEKQSYPKVDVIDYDNRVEIIAEIPGLTKDEVDVEVQDDVLTISGEKVKNVTNKEDKGNYIKKELKHSRFKRSFTLGENIDKEIPSAKFENGVLRVTLDKVKPAIPETKKVKIL